MSSARALEAPRPLKSTIKQQSLPMFQQQQSFEVHSVEDLISLTETVAQSLNQGDVSFDLFNKMFVTLQLHGPQLETYFKEVLDRCFNVFRNASQDDRLKIAIRLNLLNLIELRANSWVNKCADYYKSKANEPENELLVLGSSPSLSGMATNLIGITLGPGEIVKNSGKFTKPTKIPGKNYSKDEIIIRNSDSGKVNPGAKERLVQITGPNEESINYAKMLIEDTIKRNASPIRDASQEGSVSSLASSDDQQIAAIRPRPILTSVGNIQMQAVQNVVQQLPMGNKLTRSNSHHYFAQNQQNNNDASVGEYKYTVNVGNHTLKISGDSLKLVQAAKLILDDYFTNEEFLKSTDAIQLITDAMIPHAHQIPTQPSDSGVHLDFLTRCSSGANMLATHALDDEVFAHDPSPPLIGENKILTSSLSIESSSSSNTVTDQPLTPTGGLSRSKRSHFSRKDSTPDNKNKIEDSTANQHRISYPVDNLWWFLRNLPLTKNPPSNIEKIRDTCPFIIRDKQGDSQVIRYIDVDKFMELREKMDKRNLDLKCEDVIEIDDED